MNFCFVCVMEAILFLCGEFTYLLGNNAPWLGKQWMKKLEILTALINEGYRNTVPNYISVFWYDIEM